jgi:thioredoxin reductase (NADPH)
MDRVGPTIVGRRSTPGVGAARDLLRRNDVPHRWVDLDRDPLLPLLETDSLSASRLPLVLFPDGTQLEAPRNTRSWCRGARRASRASGAR